YYNSRFNEEGFRKSFEYLTNAINADPQFVPAYVALFEASAFGYVANGDWTKRFDMERECARKLMTLAPDLGESHAALSWVMSDSNNWTGAEAEIKRAIEMSPNYAWAHMAYGCYLAWWFPERVDEAPRYLRRAQELDPTSPVIATTLGFPFYAK